MDVLDKDPNNIFKVVKFMRKGARDVDGGRCMRGTDGKLAFSEKDRGSLWKEPMEKIINEENEWEQVTDADTWGLWNGLAERK